MPVRRLVLLSPYRMPTHHPLMLGEDDSAAWLLAYRALWHPALLAVADGLPEIADPHDHAVPQADCLYAVPSTPPAYLPENWDELVRQAGSVAFHTGANADETLTQLRKAIGPIDDVDAAEIHRFAGLGLGYIVLETLFDAMEHEHLLDVPAFAAEVKSAAQNRDQTSLQAAAQRLTSARETLYPVNIHLLDLAMVKSLPTARRGSTALTVIASAAELATLTLTEREALSAPHIEVCGGIAVERPDALLPVESQLWNLRRGAEQTRELLGRPVSVFARATSAFHPYTPLLLQYGSMTKAILIAFDGARLPTHTGASIRWPSPDGRQIEALTKTPLPASDPQTFFHLSHHLHQTIAHDSAATFVLKHGDPPAGPWYEDWLALSELAPVFGHWRTVGQYLDDGTAGEYASAATPDDFGTEELDAQVNAERGDPVTAYARHFRLRRRIDAAYAYQALLRSLGTPVDAALLQKTAQAEDDIEHNVGVEAPTLVAVEYDAAHALAGRLLSRATTGGPGRLLLNTCSYTRRVGLEYVGELPVIGGPVRAAQRDGDTVRAVVEVPGLGFAWVPATAGPAVKPKMVMADGTTVRNELFEAELDPQTGAIRSFRDARTRTNRLGQQLVWQPGSTMIAESVAVTACGAALGEVTATGTLVDEHGMTLAKFRQRVRAWIGRPLLELRIELDPVKVPVGYPWHSYFGSRFAWRDERATLGRGQFHQRSSTTQHRPTAPDYFDLRFGVMSTLVVTGGLSFHQRHGTRMLDTILIAAGETATTFEFFLGIDRPQPALSAQGAVSPVAVVAAERGPPPVGASGWLAHCDASNLVLTSLKPEVDTVAVTARFFESSGFGGSASCRWARNPQSAAVVDPEGGLVSDAVVTDDGVDFDVTAHDLANLRVSWGG